MRMTLIEGDLILVNKFIYGAKVPLPIFACRS
jgi:signal peptidase I